LKLWREKGITMIKSEKEDLRVKALKAKDLVGYDKGAVVRACDRIIWTICHGEIGARRVTKS